MSFMGDAIFMRKIKCKKVFEASEFIWFSRLNVKLRFYSSRTVTVATY